MRFKQLGIIVGTKCNFRCAHCALEDGERNRDLSVKEIRILKEAISQYAPRELLFTGGEPTLYIPLINEMISAHPAPHKCRIIVTTNGHFANSVSSARKVLASFIALDNVQVSYDKFHNKFLPLTKVKNLYTACKEMRLKFLALFAIQSPLDLSLMAALSKVGRFNIGVQKVIPHGQARKNRLGFIHTVFDRKVLAKKCPNLGRLAYTRGKGFSVCCSDLLRLKSKIQFAHPTIKEHLASDFYKLMARHSFRKLLQLVKLSDAQLKPEHSDECVLCKHIFTQRALPT